MANSWSMGLVKTILEPKNLIISSECAVVIADKYPKARHHYLVLPTTDIPTIFHLNKGHIPLLDELLLLAHNIVELRGEKLTNFKVGFHAEPSMQRLHLHVISKDFVSPFLKTKKHWNSFNTDLFIPYEHIYKQIQVDGKVKRLAKEEVQSLLSTPLLCNQCTLEAKNMPVLKTHLEQHLEKNADRGWQFAFLDEVLNRDNIIISSSEAVVLRDSYPKAQFHFLVVPKTEIENVFALNHSHLPLLDDMYDLANKVIKSETHLDPKEFLIGFKMDAMMKQLNLHVISNDFISARLKTNRHWTNFHTRVFLPFRIAYGTLKMKGVIKPLSPEELEFERKRPLVCNQCDFVTNHIFSLKTHLIKHWYEKQDQQKISDVAVTSKIDEVESQNLPTSTSVLPATSSTNAQPLEAQRAVIQHSTSKGLTQNLLPLEDLINLKKLNQTERETASSQELPKTSAKTPAPSMLVRLMEAQRAAITDSSSNGRAETSSTNSNTLKESNQTETEKAADQETSKSPPSMSALLAKESTPSTLVRMMEAQRFAIQDSPSKECAETSSPQINLITLDELNESVKAMQLSNIPTMQDSLTQAKLKLIFDTAKQKNNAGRGRWTMPNKRYGSNTLGQQSANNHGLPKCSPPVFNNVTPANQITWRNPFKQPTPLLTNGTLNNDGGKFHFKKQKQPYKPRAGSAPPGKAIPNASFVESRPPSVQQASNYHQPARNNTGEGGKFHYKKPKHPYKLVAAAPPALEKPIPTASASSAIESGATTSAESRPPLIQHASNQYKKSYMKPNQRFPKKEFRDTLTNGAPQDQDVRKSFTNKKKWQPNANYTPRTLNHQHQPNNGKPTNVPTNSSDEVMKW